MTYITDIDLPESTSDAGCACSTMLSQTWYASTLEISVYSLGTGLCSQLVSIKECGVVGALGLDVGPGLFVHCGGSKTWQNKAKLPTLSQVLMPYCGASKQPQIRMLCGESHLTTWHDCQNERWVVCKLNSSPSLLDFILHWITSYQICGWWKCRYIDVDLHIKTFTFTSGWWFSHSTVDSLNITRVYN